MRSPLMLIVGATKLLRSPSYTCCLAAALLLVNLIALAPQEHYRFAQVQTATIVSQPTATATLQPTATATLQPAATATLQPTAPPTLAPITTTTPQLVNPVLPSTTPTAPTGSGPSIVAILSVIATVMTILGVTYAILFGSTPLSTVIRSRRENPRNQVGSSSIEQKETEIKKESQYYEDWGEVDRDVSSFYGREEELAELDKWITVEHVRVIAISGVGGIGKTSLAVKLLSQIKDRYDYVFCRELKNQPLLDDILSECVRFFSNQEQTQLPESLNKRLSLLIEYLQKHRCLLLLDNAEGIMQGGERAGQYLKGYESYGKLIQRIATNTHSSCLILTTREKPVEIELLKGKQSSVRSLDLSKLDLEDAIAFLQDKGLYGSKDAFATLITNYGGNPLWLTLICPLAAVFGGSVDEFLSHRDVTLFDKQRSILDEHFGRLSAQEKEVMYWLAIEREAISIKDLRKLILSSPSEEKLIEILGSLMNRSLIERAGGSASFKLQPVIMEYTTKEWIEKVFKEIISEEVLLFNTHPLMRAQAKEYIRKSQTRTIIKPLTEVLFQSLDKNGIEDKLDRVLLYLRHTSPRLPGYAGGNILNLLHYLGYDLSKHDFSNLAIWEAYLREGDFQQVNLVGCELVRCAFVEIFSAILSVAISSDGKLLATGDANGNVHLWNIAEDQLLFTFPAHAGWVRSVSFNRDNQILASGSDDETIKLWDVHTGQSVNTLRGHNSHVRAITFSPQNNQILASASADWTAKLWDIMTGKCIATLAEHTDWTRTVAFSPDGQTLATGSHDHTIKLWNVVTGKCYRTLEGHSRQVVSVTFSPDGQTLASAGQDFTIRVWDVKSGVHLKTLQHSKIPMSIAFHPIPESNLLVSGGDDNTIRLWDISTGQCIRTMTDHDDWVRSVVFSPDGRTLASGSDDQTVRIWEVDSGYCLKIFRGYASSVWTLAINPSDRTLVSGGSDELVRVWDISQSSPVKNLQGHTSYVWDLDFNQDGHLLCSGSGDYTIRVWDVESGTCCAILREHTNQVRSVAFAPAGKLLASGSDDLTVKIWDLATNSSRYTFTRHSSQVWCVAFSPDGRTLASAGEDHIVMLWDVETGEFIEALYGHKNRILALAFSPDGQLVASGSEDQTVRLWDVSNLEEKRQGKKTIVEGASSTISSSTEPFMANVQVTKNRVLEGHTNWVQSIDFSPDSRILASSSDDRTVKLWSVATGECLKTLAHEHWVRTVVFDLDGMTLISGSQDGTIRLWNVNSGECLKSLRVPSPYEGMNITAVKGLTDAQRSTLIALGAKDLNSTSK